MQNNVNTFNSAKIKPSTMGMSGKDAEKINAVLSEMRQFENAHNYLIDILQQQIRIINVAISAGLVVSSSGVLSLGNELTALQLLADTVGLVKKTGDGAYAIDETTYQVQSNELDALSALADTAGFIKKTGDGTYSIDTRDFGAESNWRFV